MKKYLGLLFIFIFSRVILSLVLTPFGGSFGAIVEAVILLLFTIGCAFICNKLKKVVNDSKAPTMSENLCSTVVFSGLLLLSYPVDYFVGAVLPVLTYKTNLMCRFEECFAVIYLFIPISLALLFTSVSAVKIFDFELKLKPMLIGGLAFALVGMSFQSFLFDFIFGCFIYTFLIRYGNVAVSAVYIVLYKLMWMILEFGKYSFIGDTATDLLAELPYFLGTFMLFGSVLLLGIYLDLRFFKYKKKMPLFTAFALPSTVLMGVIGYFILNYIQT